MIGLRCRPSIGRLAAPLAASLLFVAPLAARAQVLEIGAHGEVARYDGPAVFSASGGVPILPTRAPRLPPAARARQANGEDIRSAALAADLSPELIEAVARQESGLRAGVVSRAGAVGEMQLMPATARALGVDPRVTRENYRGGAGYLRILMHRYDGDVVRALSAYNAGPGAVDRYGGTPPYRETQAYVAAVLERLGRRAVEEGEAK